MRVCVLVRHRYEDFELLGVFTTPEKFQQFVERKFPRFDGGREVASWECRVAPRYCRVGVRGDAGGDRLFRIYERNTQQTAVTFVDYVLSKLPFKVECIQTDNGSEFGPQFHWHLLDKGIQHRYIRPRRPYLNGKSERSPLNRR